MTPCGVGACPKSYPNERGAQQHRAKAHGVTVDSIRRPSMPHACDYPRCSERYETAEGLRRHRSRQHGIRGTSAAMANRAAVDAHNLAVAKMRARMERGGHRDLYGFLHLILESRPATRAAVAQ